MAVMTFNNNSLIKHDPDKVVFEVTLGDGTIVYPTFTRGGYKNRQFRYELSPGTSTKPFTKKELRDIYDYLAVHSSTPHLFYKGGDLDVNKTTLKVPVRVKEKNGNGFEFRNTWVELFKLDHGTLFDKNKQVIMSYIQQDVNLTSASTQSTREDVLATFLWWLMMNVSPSRNLQNMTSQDIIDYMNHLQQSDVYTEGYVIAFETAIEAFCAITGKMNLLSIVPKVNRTSSVDRVVEYTKDPTMYELLRLLKKEGRVNAKKMRDAKITADADELAKAIEERIRIIRNEAIFQLIRYHGLEVSEVTSLQLVDYDKKTKDLKVTGRRGNMRVIRLEPIVAKAIDHYLKKRMDTNVELFVSLNKQYANGVLVKEYHQMDASAIRRIFKESNTTARALRNMAIKNFIDQHRGTLPDKELRNTAIAQFNSEKNVKQFM